MDVHVPASITRGLLLRGVDVLTAQLDGANQVIYAHQLGITIGRTIQDLQILADAGAPEDFANRVE